VGTNGLAFSPDEKYLYVDDWDEKRKVVVRTDRALPRPPRHARHPSVTRADPSPAADDARLLAALRAGHDAAFATLVRTHGARLLAVARRLLRDEDDARDALQDAFLSAFRSLDGFKEGAQLSTWLHRIVVNAALMRLRARKRRPEDPIEDLLPAFLEDGHRAHAENPDDPWRESAEVALERKETRAFVRACIDRLPDPYRTVLLLRDIEDLDTEETARMLEITPNNVKVRLHRARQALRALLDPHFRTTPT
jgi:RNA polymerase sigma-70 factor (ECF subfamily)